MTLSPRELEVCRAIVNGRLNKQIADEQGRALGTIKSQIKVLMLKTGQRTRTSLAVWAVRQGIE